MTIEDLQSICKTFPGTTEDIKWEDHLCFNVGGKMYLVTSPGTIPHTASFKVSDEIFEEISSREGFKPAAYLARYKWVYIDDINRIGKRNGLYSCARPMSWYLQSYPPKQERKLPTDRTGRLPFFYAPPFSSCSIF